MKVKGKLLVSPKDVTPSFPKWKVVGVLNPGVIRLPNKKIMMYARVAEEAKHSHGKGRVCPVMTSPTDYKVGYEKIHGREIVGNIGKEPVFRLRDGTCRLPNISHFRPITINENGLDVEEISQKPIFAGIPGESSYGVEDPRITKIGGTYYMAYVGISVKQGVSTYLASSKDMKKWKRLGMIFREQNKDVVLFPEKIKGEYVALNRPESLFNFSRPGIWISYSKDLIYWGKDHNLMRPRPKTWENDRIGGGAPPLKTKKGWLVIYHGMTERGGKRKYSGGAALLDLKNPEHIIARSSEKDPLIKPDQKFEKEGYIANVVFPTAVIPSLNKKNVLIYSGGADSVIGVREMALNDIFKHLKV